MPDPRYRPRDFSSTPRLFGRTEGIDWPSPDDSSRSRSMAAQFQHRMMIHVNKHLAQEGAPSREAFAEELGLSYDRLSRILRGELVVQLDEVMSLSRAIGLVLRFQHRDASPH